MPTIRIGMDEWAVADGAGQTKLYTAGLSGCVAVCLLSPSRIGLTHVASDAGRALGSAREVLHPWAPYEQELGRMLVEMRRASPTITATLVVNGRNDQQKTPYTLIAEWLGREGIPVTKTVIDTGVMLETGRDPVGNGLLSMEQRTRGYLRLFEQAAKAVIVSSGELSTQASRPQRAADGVRHEDEDEFD